MSLLGIELSLLSRPTVLRPVSSFNQEWFRSQQVWQRDSGEFTGIWGYVIISGTAPSIMI